MEDLAGMRALKAVIEAGSFSAAARRLGVKTSAVSRAVAALERNLGVGLFLRTTRKVHPTEAGGTLYQHALRVLREIEEARSAVSAIAERPQGLLRLHLPAAFARLHVMPFIPDFLERYPDIRLDVGLSDIRVDLVSVGVDAAIRIGPMLDSSLIARRLAPHRRVVCASPAYLAKGGPLQQPDDLLRHNCLIYSLQPSPYWYFRRDGRESSVAVSGRLRSDDSGPLRDAAVAGVGVVLLPTWLVGPDLAEGRLRHVLPDWEAMIATAPSGIFGIHAPGGPVAPKVRVFLDFIQERFGRPPYWESWEAAG